MAEPNEVRGVGRDREELHDQLAAWFSDRLPGAEPMITALQLPDSNGMSSETVLFDLTLTEGGERITRASVARLAPAPANVPVFPTYDMAAQFHVISLVEERTDVPVPKPRWLEPEGGPVGTPFFVMDRVNGRVPPDVMPYNFGSWLKDADPADRRRLVEATMAAIAGIHTITPDNADLGFLELDEPGDTALRRHVAGARSYYEWATDGVAMPLIEDCFDWLDDHWPTDEGPTVLLWGDARIGNVLYDGFDPVAVLDWEMAGVGPAELDVTWGIFLHRFFEDIATDAGVEGMPDFLRTADVAAVYEKASGYAPRDLHFYLMYAALRHGVVMSRIFLRQVSQGAAEIPDDPADMILHRKTLEAMLDGTYWSRL